MYFANHAFYLKNISWYFISRNFLIFVFQFIHRFTYEYLIHGLNWFYYNYKSNWILHIFYLELLVLPSAWSRVLNLTIIIRKVKKLLNWWHLSGWWGPLVSMSPVSRISFKYLTKMEAPNVIHLWPKGTTLEFLM